MNRPQPHNVLFRSNRGPAVSYDAVHYQWRKVCRAADLMDAGNPRYTLHQLRHTRGSELLAQGQPIEIVQRDLGHRDIHSTLLYAELNEDKVTLTDYCQTNTASCIGEGAANAPVTIIEISDFGCPHCRDFHQQTWPAVCAETQVWAQLLRMSFPKRKKSRLLKGGKEGG